jgi:capsular polysaccharide biosynthesis protein
VPPEAQLPPAPSAPHAAPPEDDPTADYTPAFYPAPSDRTVWVERPTAATIIWKRKLWIVLFAILAGVGTTFGARIPSPSYSSSAVLEVTVQQTTGVPNETLLAANGLAAQYAQLSTTTAVLERAADQLKVPAGDLAHSVSASTVSQLNLVKVSASGSSPAQAEQRANATARALTAIIVRTNRQKAVAFVRTATAPLAANTRQIAALQAQITASSKALAAATTESERAQAQTILLGQQSTLTALTTQRSSLQSGLSVDAALGQPSVAVVSLAGPGSRSQLSPIAYGLIGALAGAIVISQLFVLAGSRRQLIRIGPRGDHPDGW